MKIEYTNGDACSNDESWHLSVEIFCVDGEYDFEDVTIDESVECHPKITFKSKAGCPVLNMEALWRWLNNNAIIFGILEIILAFIFVVFGRKFFKIIVFFIGIILTVVLFWIIFFSFFIEKTSSD